MEIADVFAINKADLAGADRLEQEIRAMQSFADASERKEAAPVRRVVATEGKGVDELLKVIRSVFEKRGQQSARVETWSFRLREMLRESLFASVPEEEIQRHADLVAEKMEDPYTAIAELRQQIPRL
jgi:LAO/AO transport system kinase